MRLTGWVARQSVRATHVLVVEVPGHWLSRVRVERVVRERGWRLAFSPADADLLAVGGVPGTQLEPVIERVWEQMRPGWYLVKTQPRWHSRERDTLIEKAM